jgi:hypothetical protein
LYGGLVLSASRDSLSILIRALQEDGRIQILSRPQITTLDSQPATVFVGENIARPGAAVQNANTTQTSVEYEDVGLQMLVTPRVTPDGTVVMDIDTTKSRIDYTRTVTIAETVIPNIATINAATTISARSGQTVAFAGLIQTDSQQSVKGIPYISRLPVVGPLLSYTEDREIRTELLVIMTPHVIRAEEELDMFRYSESERMSWCLADVLELYGDVGLSSRPGDWCPCGGCGHCHICRSHEGAPVIFPDSNPTGVIEHVETEPVPVPVPEEEELRLPPPVHTSGTQMRPVAPTDQPVVQMAGTPAPGQPPAQFPAATAAYSGTVWMPNQQTAEAAWRSGGNAPVPQAPQEVTARRLPPSPQR